MLMSAPPTMNIFAGGGKVVVVDQPGAGGIPAGDCLGVVSCLVNLVNIGIDDGAILALHRDAAADSDGGIVAAAEKDAVNDDVIGLQKRRCFVGRRDRHRRYR